MKLNTYLDQSGLSASAFAAKVEVSRQAMSRYVSGQRIPPKSTMARIVAATGGAVTPADFYDIPQEPVSADSAPYRPTADSLAVSDALLRAERE